ncbi:MAG: hypothetical protein ACLVC4_06315 [Gordonibacter urolithinfaciens]
MPTFTYTGLSVTGDKVSGVVEAYDEIEGNVQFFAHFDSRIASR